MAGLGQPIVKEKKNELYLYSKARNDFLYF